VRPENPESRLETGDTLNLRARRAVSGGVFAVGAILVIWSVFCAPAARNACILFGLVLAVPAFVCLGVDFLLQRAVRAVREPRLKEE
jgi:hypothetical protein